MANVLDHIAWNVICANAEEFESPQFRSNRLIDWGNGRGGFLADDMIALHDATVRLQVPSHHLPPDQSAETNNEGRVASRMQRKNPCQRNGIL